MGDRLLRRREVEELTGLSRASIYRLMRGGRFPATCQGQHYGRQVEGKRNHHLDTVPAGGGGNSRRQLATHRLCREVVRPLLHERPAADEQIGPCIGLFDTAAKQMGQCRLADCPGCIRLFHRPCLEGRSEPVAPSPGRQGRLNGGPSSGSCRSASCQVADETGNRYPNHPPAAVPGSTPRGPGRSGGPDALGPPSCARRGIVHVASSRPISSHVAPLASPERAAVRTRNLRQRFATSDVWDASTVLRAEPTSW